MYIIIIIIKRPQVLKLGHNTNSLSGPDFSFLSYFWCHVTLKLAVSRSWPPVPYGPNLFVFMPAIWTNTDHSVCYNWQTVGDTGWLYCWSFHVGELIQVVLGLNSESNPTIKVVGSDTQNLINNTSLFASELFWFSMIDFVSDVGWQHEACNRGLVAVATLLLDNGAMIDVPGHDHETALHDAVNNGQVDCVRLLVARGASLTLRWGFSLHVAGLTLSPSWTSWFNTFIHIDYLVRSTPSRWPNKVDLKCPSLHKRFLRF